MLRTLFTYTVLSLLFVPLVIAALTLASAQVMQSTNYQIDSDSLNVTGGFSSSDSFQMESTVGEVATGDSDSSSFSVRAGFQQMQAVQISLSLIDSVILSEDVFGVTGGTSNGSTTFTVITDNPAGYEVVMSAATAPAMQATVGTSTIADYNPTGITDYTFRLDTGESHFGYSVEGVHAVQRFLYDGGVCNTGVNNSALQCWDGASTTNATLVESGTSNHPGGSTTTLHFRVGIADSVNQTPGTYVATTTITAVPL